MARSLQNIKHLVLFAVETEEYMPELPEVETIKNAVKNTFIGARIEKATVRQPKLRESVPADFAQRIEGATIVALKRIAKYMLMELDNGLTIIWHFGMSGKIRIEQNNLTNPQKHDHLWLETSMGVLVYNDPRRFGLVTLCSSESTRCHHLLQNLGLDPWDEGLTDDYLLSKFAHKKCAVKLALLDQTIICGIGNIYASEILYLARILPTRTAESINSDEASRLVKYTRIVLEKAIKAGGSTIHDYVHPDGKSGNFQESHCVYNKTGLRCPQCRCDITKTGGIKKTVIGGRSTFYCETLQK